MLVNYNLVGVVRLLSMGSAASEYYYTLFSSLIAGLLKVHSTAIILSASHLKQGIYRSLQMHHFFNIKIFSIGVAGEQAKDEDVGHLIHSFMALLVCLSA